MRAFISSLHSLPFLISLIPPRLCWNKPPKPPTKAPLPSFSPYQRRSWSPQQPALTQINCSSGASDRSSPGAGRVCQKLLGRVSANAETPEVDPRTEPSPTKASGVQKLSARVSPSIPVDGKRRFPYAAGLRGGINARALLGKALIPVSFIPVVLSLLQLSSDGFTMGPSGRKGNAAGSRPLTLPPPPLPFPLPRFRAPRWLPDVRSSLSDCTDAPAPLLTWRADVLAVKDQFVAFFSFLSFFF